MFTIFFPAVVWITGTIIQKIEAEKARLNYSGETDQTKAVLDAVKRFDTEYRTVEGITFLTRSEAEESRTELPAIHEIEQGIDYHSLASIDAGEQKIAALTSPLAASRRRAIQQKRNSLDLELRTVSTLLSGRETICCKTLEEADQLRVTVKELKGKLDACGKGISAEQPLLQFKSELDAMEIPVEVKKRYQTEIESRLTAIDLDLRTALGKEYPTREAAKEAEQLYNQIRSDFVTGNPRKNGDKFHKRIESADFSEKVKEKLLGELFQYENAKEIKASKIIGTISSAILLVIIISSYFFRLSGSPVFASKNVVVHGVSLMLTDVQVTDSLGFIEGMKNGFLVFGRCIGDIFKNGFFEYIGNFDRGFLGNILWAVLGLFVVIIKHLFLGIARYLVSLVVTLFQAAPIRYYIGYFIGSAIPISVSQFVFDEEKQIENVERIKGWTAKKLTLSLLAIIVVVMIVLYFVRQEM